MLDPTAYKYVAECLNQWDRGIQTEYLKLIEATSIVWKDGSLGCPLPGRCYTQALVPGYVLLFQYGDLVIEVHTDEPMKKIALPGVGTI